MAQAQPAMQAMPVHPQALGGMPWPPPHVFMGHPYGQPFPQQAYAQPPPMALYLPAGGYPLQYAGQQAPPGGGAGEGGRGGATFPQLVPVMFPPALAANALQAALAGLPVGTAVDGQQQQRQVCEGRRSGKSLMVA